MSASCDGDECDDTDDLADRVVRGLARLIDPVELVFGDRVGGRFTIRSAPVAGGMGEVYRADDDRAVDKGTVAVKVLKADISFDPAARVRFTREQRCIQTVALAARSPEVLDAGTREEDDRPWFALRWVRGKTLATALAEHRAAPTAAGRTALVADVRKVCGALAVAHRNGFVHRDVKPDNVMLVREDGLAALIDWGIVRDLNDPDDASAAGGTDDYLSPEQATGRDAREPTDVFAGGAILCELLLGRPPYRDAAGAEIGAACNGVPDDTRKCLARAGGELASLALDCLHTDPARRPTMAKVCARLDAYLQGRRRVRRALAGLGGVAALVAVGFAAYAADAHFARLAAAFATPEPEANLGEPAAAVRGERAPLAGWRVGHHLHRRVGDPGNGTDAVPRAGAAAGLVLLGRGADVWPLLAYDADPRVRYQFVRRLVTAGVPADDLVAAAKAETTPGVRQGLILALGLYDAGTVLKPAEHLLAYRPPLPAARRPALAAWLNGVYETDPDPGVHGAAGWVLRRWGVDTRALDAALLPTRGEAALLAARANGKNWRWYVTAHGQTMVVIDVPDGGASYPLAVSATEVTDEQFEKGCARDPNNPARVKNDPTRAACWLTPERVGEYAAALTAAQRAVGGGEYRPPTAAEWGALSAGCRRLGPLWAADPAAVDWFAWSSPRVNDHAGGRENSPAPAGRLMPDPLGLFDVLGNVMEYSGRGTGEAGRPAARGGSYFFTRETLKLDASDGFGKAVDQGFRVVRRLPPLP